MTVVLIVDDSAVARRALAMRLEADGHTVVEEASAGTGAAAGLDGVGCAVLDLELGDGDGVQVAVQLRARAPRLPIAFFTGASTTALAARARSHGPVFAKPDDLDAVVAWAKSAHGA